MVSRIRIPRRRVRSPPRSVLDMTLNCIWLRDSSFRECGVLLHYHSSQLYFIRIPFVGQIDLVKSYSYSLGPHAKNKINKWITSYETSTLKTHNEGDIFTSRYKITQSGSILRLKTKNWVNIWEQQVPKINLSN